MAFEHGLLLVCVQHCWAFFFGISGVSSREKNVENVNAARDADGICSFQVALGHAGQEWYVDTEWNRDVTAWTVLVPDGTLVGGRVLYLLHVDEPPFT